MPSPRTSTFAFASIASVLAACGSSGEPDVDPTNGGPAAAFADPAANGSGSVTPADVDPSSACATSSALGEGSPASLVFMFDRSGSMLDANKWVESSSALKSFFTDAASTGLSASLQFFPQGPVDSPECAANAYQAPAVPMTQLPNAQQFASAINGVKVQSKAPTPTLPALTGALAYAKSVEASGKNAAVVLVTDGEPNQCGSTVASVSKVAAAAAGSVKTYVVGVGDNLKNLNAIAAAGGTGAAILVSTTDPAKIASDLKAALGSIAAQAMTCDYKIPLPPNGQTIDPQKVNVRQSPKTGAGATLSYNAACTGEGWRYDNVASPSRILLCPASCDQAMKSPGTKVEVFFGCAVKGGIPK